MSGEVYSLFSDCGVDALDALDLLRAVDLLEMVDEFGVFGEVTVADATNVGSFEAGQGLGFGWRGGDVEGGERGGVSGEGGDETEGGGSEA